MSLRVASPSHAEELIHGISVHDPYRWLEDRNSSETFNWIADQQRRYDDFFGQAEDLDIVRDQVREYLDVETVDQPARVANQYFYRRRNRGSEQACIYVRNISTGQERLLVDPSTRGTFTSVAIHRISLDGSLLAYELRQGGEDKIAIHVVDVKRGDQLPDEVPLGYARGFTFATDQSGFYYCQEGTDECEDHTIRFHSFGEEALDQIVYRLPRSVGSKLVLTSDDVHLGAVCVHHVDGERVSDISIARREAPANWKNILANIQPTLRPWLTSGHIFAIDFRDAPNGQLIELNHDGDKVRVVIPERLQAIQQLVVVGDRIVVTYLNDWGTVTESWATSGEYIGRLAVPIDGTIRLLQSPGFDALFCTYESFTQPLTTFEFDPDSGSIGLWHKQAHCIEQRTSYTRPVIATSKDGTLIPMMLVARTEPELTRNNPVIMTGYGGFGASVTPQYSVLVSIMLELGCTFALARIRGGGEFGESWHDAGRRGKRQNSFDDFIAAAEWLCAEGFTSPERLAMFGGSNGGLLMGAVLTQRADLFRAVLCIAPLLDMVRYEIFDHAARWRNEYGSVDNADDFSALYAYSPYHHVEDTVDYPAVLFISGDRDDRCNPAHVRKMAARLQQREAQTRPILVDYSRDRGHSPVLPFSVRIESLARRITFLFRALNIELHRRPR